MKTFLAILAGVLLCASAQAVDIPFGDYAGRSLRAARRQVLSRNNGHITTKSER